MVSKESHTDHGGHLGRATPMGDVKPPASGPGHSIVGLLFHDCILEGSRKGVVRNLQ